MSKYRVIDKLFAVALIGVSLLLVACGGGPAPTSTPPPPTEVIPPTLPPAPTAPPLTPEPTPIPPTPVPPTQAPPPPTLAATASPTASPLPTNAPPTAAAVISPTLTIAAPTANAPEPPPQQGALQGLYIGGLRYEPGYPQTNQPVTFYATIENRTGKEQHYPVCVEIFRPGESKSFGISNCETVTIPAETGEVVAGEWRPSGYKECQPVRARAVLSEEETGTIHLVFVTLTGGELWVDFNVCP